MDPSNPFIPRITGWYAIPWMGTKFPVYERPSWIKRNAVKWLLGWGYTENRTP